VQRIFTGNFDSPWLAGRRLAQRLWHGVHEDFSRNGRPSRATNCRVSTTGAAGSDRHQARITARDDEECRFFDVGSSTRRDAYAGNAGCVGLDDPEVMTIEKRAVDSCSKGYQATRK
jgi:hypothetical protein